VAACAFVFLGPSLFLLSSLDLVRRANAKKERGEAPSRAAAVALLPFRGLVGLFGITSALIGAVVCLWILFVSHTGGLPLLVSLFLGTIVLRRVFWARESVYFGGELVRVALGRKAPEPTWTEAERAWSGPEVFVGSLQLEPHGEVPLELPGSREEPDPDARTLAQVLAARYPTLRPEIESRLFAHHRRLQERHERGEQPTATLPPLLVPSDVWSHVTVDRIRIAPVDGSAPIEIALTPDGDVGGELCLRLHVWQRFELECDD